MRLTQTPSHRLRPAESLSGRPCPICRSHLTFRRDGWQDYSTDHGPIRSQIFRCTGCDLGLRVFANDAPPPLAEHFRAAWYSADDIEQTLYNRRIGFYEYLLDLLQSNGAQRRLFDVGCGFGHFLQAARRRGYQPSGSEVDRQFATRAQSRSGCPVVSGGLSTLRSVSARFDVITLIDSFYYFDDPVTVLRDCARLLRPGGQILIRTTNRNHLARLHRWKSLLLGGRDRELPFWTTDDAICCHSRRSLTMALAAAGFDIVRISGKEPGKRLEPGLRSMALAAAQWIERLTAGTVSTSSGIIVIARRREIVRTAQCGVRPNERSRRPDESLIARSTES